MGRFFHGGRRSGWWLLCLILAGCGGKDTLLPQDGATMLDIYRSHAGRAGHGGAVAVRAEGCPTPDPTVIPSLRARSTLSEIRWRFPRLANPDLLLFTYPHLSTEEGVPVPGYMTAFPLYERNHYALPGEPTE